MSDLNKESRTSSEETMSDAEFEAFYADLRKEFGSTGDQDENLVADFPDRNAAAKTSGRSAAKAAEKSAAPRRNTYTDSRTAEPEPRRDSSIRVLSVLICVECAGIVGVVLWWLLRIL